MNLSDTGKAVVLMPLSQYKRNELYRHVESFELANPKMFKDASITTNLNICELRKCFVDKFSWERLNVEATDISIRLFYEWNTSNSKGLYLQRKDYADKSKFNRDLDFVDTAFCFAKYKGAGYFAKGGFGYKWNMTQNDVNIGNNISYMHFNSKKAKDNFCKYAYNYTNDKYDCLASKALCGVNGSTASSNYYFAIPQIDWEKISDHELWKKGMYDEAVLDTMQLKWDEKKERIVKKNLMI